MSAMRFLSTLTWGCPGRIVEDKMGAIWWTWGSTHRGQLDRITKAEMYVNGVVPELFTQRVP